MTNLLLPLRDIDEGGEDEGADAKEHEDKAQLLVGSPHGVAQPLQALGVPGERVWPHTPFSHYEALQASATISFSQR